MTIEQEIKLQARYLAQDMAKDMAQSKVDESKFETAKKMLENNIPAEIVAKCTGLEIFQVDKLKK